MMNQIRFKDDLEKNQHEEAISLLCEQFPGQNDLIRSSYMKNLEHLIADAHIRTYLPIFVSRKVRLSLEH